MTAPPFTPPAGAHIATMRLHTLQDLRVAHDRRRGLRHSTVVVDLPGLAPDEAAAVSLRLTDLLAECGCSEGARAMAGGAAVSLAGLVVLTGGPSWRLLALSPLVVLGSLVGAAGGKVFGLARSRRAFRRDVQRLIHQQHTISRGT
jgi:hypothetical protein